MSKPADIIIFGGTGDLATRKLMPALFRCEMEGSLDPEVRIFCLSRDFTGGDEELCDHVLAGLEQYVGGDSIDQAAWQRFAARLHLLALEITEFDPRWAQLGEQLAGREETMRVFYLAVSPKLYEAACDHLAHVDLITDQSRIVLEKPIGHNYASAKAINDAVARHFGEQNIYRIDHYLGKETVQNLLAVRFTNTLFEQMWNGQAIDHVQITLAERVGVEGRGDFYDQTGALKDMVQNHMLQLLCLVAMEPPHRMDAHNIRLEKSKVLQALRPIIGGDVGHDVVRGQYRSGELDGNTVPGYTEELGRSSDTETFVAIRAHIDNWRWAGTPFYLRTGKRLAQRYAEIVVQFRPLSHRAYPAETGALIQNKLIIRLQPEESMRLIIMTKDLDRNEFFLKPMALNLNLAEGNRSKHKSDGYQRLLQDVMAGNQTLFAHCDEIEQAWRWLDPIVAGWERSDEGPLRYAAGTYGPAAADRLLGDSGRSWLPAGGNA